jgi:hypothetical protein
MTLSIFDEQFEQKIADRINESALFMKNIFSHHTDFFISTTGSAKYKLTILKLLDDLILRRPNLSTIIYNIKVQYDGLKALMNKSSELYQELSLQIYVLSAYQSLILQKIQYKSENRIPELKGIRSQIDKFRVHIVDTLCEMMDRYSLVYMKNTYDAAYELADFIFLHTPQLQINDNFTQTFQFILQIFNQWETVTHWLLIESQKYYKENTQEIHNIIVHCSYEKCKEFYSLVFQVKKILLIYQKNLTEFTQHINKITSPLAQKHIKQINKLLEQQPTVHLFDLIHKKCQHLSLALELTDSSSPIPPPLPPLPFINDLSTIYDFNIRIIDYIDEICLSILAFETENSHHTYTLQAVNTIKSSLIELKNHALTTVNSPPSIVKSIQLITDILELHKITNKIFSKEKTKSSSLYADINGFYKLAQIKTELKKLYNSASHPPSSSNIDTLQLLRKIAPDFQDFITLIKLIDLKQDTKTLLKIPHSQETKCLYEMIVKLLD